MNFYTAGVTRVVTRKRKNHPEIWRADEFQGVYI